MPLYMYQGAYTSQSWAAQVKKPQNRIETVAARRAKPSEESLSAHGIASAISISLSSWTSRTTKV